MIKFFLTLIRLNKISKLQKKRIDNCMNYNLNGLLCFKLCKFSCLWVRINFFCLCEQIFALWWQNKKIFLKRVFFWEEERGKNKISSIQRAKNIIHYWSSSVLCPCPRENHPLGKFINHPFQKFIPFASLSNRRIIHRKEKMIHDWRSFHFASVSREKSSI